MPHGYVTGSQTVLMEVTKETAPPVQRTNSNAQMANAYRRRSLAITFMIVKIILMKATPNAHVILSLNLNAMLEDA